MHYLFWIDFYSTIKQRVYKILNTAKEKNKYKRVDFKLNSCLHTRKQCFYLYEFYEVTDDEEYKHKGMTKIWYD